MDINTKNLDAALDQAKEVAEISQEKVSEFHDNYVSDVIPDMGKYGDVAKFSAEMVPGVEEYNSLVEGDWQAFAIAAGVDIAAIAAGAFTAGAGYAAVKGGSVAVKAGAKVGIKELAEKRVKKSIKEVSESSAEKATLKIGDKIDKIKFPEYLSDIEKITKREIPTNQKELIEKALKENDYKKISPEEQARVKKEYRDLKAKMIEEWEINTNQKWPIYEKDVLDKDGKVLRPAGKPYDLHHIIEQSVGGPNEWWNAHPAKFPDEHQAGIHRKDGIARLIF